MKRIPVAGPWMTEREAEYAADAARNAWYDTAGEYPRRFEHGMAEYVGVRHAVSLPHCTAGIHLSLVALEVGPGDEVIVPDATWIASAAPITYVGATTVFADVDPDTWCLAVDAFKSCITPRTKAVIPVHLYGGVADMDAIRAVAEHHRIAIIEDAAGAVGSELRGHKAGSMGDTGVFSFHGSKTLATGEGGMVVTNSDELFERILFLRDHGRVPGDRHFLNREVAFKYKMSALQAAVGLAQLERIEELVARKREIFAWYREELSDFDGLRLNAEPEGTLNSYWMVTAIVDRHFGLGKRELVERLDERNIDARPFFHPLSSIPAYADTEEARVARERNVVSYEISPYGINLPSALELTREQVAFVSDSLKEILAGKC